MKEFQERNNAKKSMSRLYSPLSIIILVIILVLVARGTYSIYLKENDTSQEVAQVEKEKADLEARYAALQEDSNNLETPQGIEAEIRTKFDVVKPGEGVIMVVDKDIPAIEPDNRSVLKKFWDSVVGVFKKTSSQASPGPTSGGPAIPPPDSESGSSLQ